MILKWRRLKYSNDEFALQWMLCTDTRFVHGAYLFDFEVTHLNEVDKYISGDYTDIKSLEEE